MKKQIAALIAVGVVSFSSLALAADATPAAAPPATPVTAPAADHAAAPTAMKNVEATLVKIDGEFYMLKDKTGKEFKGHFNDKTKKVGNIKAGSMVVVSIDDTGHTTEIKEHKSH